MKSKLPSPPANVNPPLGLSGRSQSLWRAVLASGRAKSPGRLALLAETLAALDRADACARAVDRDGLTVTTPRSGVAHAHPLLLAELTFRRQFLAGAKQLDLGRGSAGVDDFLAQFSGTANLEDDL